MNETVSDKMIPAERQKKIIELLKENGAVKAAEIK